MIHWQIVVRSCLGLTPRRRTVLAGAFLLALALVGANLLLTPLVASAASAPDPRGQPVWVSPLKGRPTHTPTPVPTALPSPTPTATVAPSSTPLPTTATTVPTVAAIGTAEVGAKNGGSLGTAHRLSQAPGSLGMLLGWVLGTLIVVVLIISVFIVLFVQRTALEESPLVFAASGESTARTRLNQLYHWLPALRVRFLRRGREESAPVREQDDDWEELTSSQETPSLAPLKPPRWLIEAGLLNEETGELPTERAKEC